MSKKLRINYNGPTDVVALKEGEEQNQSLSPYTMFKYSIRSELTRKYYERRLRKFLDFIQFEIGAKRHRKEMQQFCRKGKK